ncbi:MAG: hypothetical protein HY517_02125 [Candidatus Aenigmarchaeota archaeon]|nr:hypothetical protein [Candidatus Aenigmarchaeota archaeon]
MQHKTSLKPFERILIDRLFDWGVVETDEARMPDWVVQGFFLKLGRALGTGESLSALADLFGDEIGRSAPEIPDYVYGPYYKGVPLAALTSIKLEEKGRKPVVFGFSLPHDSTIGIKEAFNRRFDGVGGDFGRDVREVERIYVTYDDTKDSSSLRAWSRERAAALQNFFDPNPGETSNRFNLIVGDGSAIPAAAAVAAEMAQHGRNPYFAIPRRTSQSVEEAGRTYETNYGHYFERELASARADGLNDNDAKTRARERAKASAQDDAQERLFVGYAPDDSRYVLFQPFKEEVPAKKAASRPRAFGQPTKAGGSYIVVDDSMVTGRAMKSAAHEVSMRYGNGDRTMRFLGGFSIVHIQEIPPQMAGKRGLASASSMRQETEPRLALHPMITTPQIAEYLWAAGKLSGAGYQRYLVARGRYGIENYMLPQ